MVLEHSIKEFKATFPETYKIVQKMCSMVKAPVKTIEEEKFYNKYTWSQVREQEFKDWFVNYVYSNSKSRKELMRFPVKKKKSISKLANEFVLNYGWCYKK